MEKHNFASWFRGGPPKFYTQNHRLQTLLLESTWRVLAAINERHFPRQSTRFQVPTLSEKGVKGAYSLEVHSDHLVEVRAWKTE